MNEYLLHPKVRLYIILAIILAGVLAFFLYQYSSRSPKSPKGEEQKVGVSVPEFPQTNPFEEAKTNPFRDIKTNPFE